MVLFTSEQVYLILVLRKTLMIGFLGREMSGRNKLTVHLRLRRKGI